MTKCNHYKINSESEVLVYGEEPQLPESLKPELLHEDIDPSDPEYINIPIISKDLLFLSMLGITTRDKVLEDENIQTYNDISNAYFLIKTKALRKPRRIRDFINEKYAEIVELVKNPITDENI